MLKFFRWLLYLFLASVFLLGFGSGVAYFLVSRSVPDYNQIHPVVGLNGTVEIVRDSYNIPHIFGDTDEDVFFGLGFVHAQDRLWQMTFLRRVAQGRLSEMFGRQSLRTDELMRQLDIYSLALASVDAQDQETKSALEAYSDGVNAWLNVVNDRMFGWGAPEFILFPAETRPWRPADSIAILNLQAIQLSAHLDDELLRGRIEEKLPLELVRDILPEYPGSDIVHPSSQSITPFPNRTKRIQSLDGYGFAYYPFSGRGFGGASNAWAVAPNRAAAGGTLLANDPHLEFSAPSIWMLARLELSSGGVIGGTIPGIPLVPVGRSEQLAWGLTYSYMDNQDVYFEKLDPSNDTRYLTPKGYRDFRSRISVIPVRDEAPVSVRLRWTENGPVIPARSDLSDLVPDGHVASLAWTMLRPNNTTMTAGIRLMKSASVGEALEMGRWYRAPSMNLMLADRKEIAMQMIGAQPRRHVFHETKGRKPSAGWKHVNRWLGEMAFDEMPRHRDPQDGVLVNSNNKTVDDAFPFHFSYLWGDTQRIRRLVELISNREVHTRESFVEAQLDTVSFTARSLLSLVGRDLWHLKDTASDDEKVNRRNNALSKLHSWTGEMNEHWPEPLIFAEWMRMLFQFLAKDELGFLFEEFSHPDPVFIERVFRAVDTASIWCDIIQTAQVELCPEIAAIALDSALANLSVRYGKDISKWRWGDAHRALHEHPVLGQTPLLSWLVNIRQSTSGGDNTLNRGLTRGVGENPYNNVHGPGYRAVYDFSEPDASMFIISTGQSGHPFSRHYDDLGQLWRRGEYVTMSLDPEISRSAPVGITVLQPALN